MEVSLESFEERVVLVGVQTDDHDNVEESLDELKELCINCGSCYSGKNHSES